MMKFDTHKFLYTLVYEKKVSDLEIEFYDKESNLCRVNVKELIVSNSPISCKVVLKSNSSKCFRDLRIPYIRIFKVFKKGKVIWENSDVDSSDFKVI